MLSTTTYRTTRMVEAMSVARAIDIVNQLHALILEESSKRYHATRQQRRQLALGLVNVAQAIVDQLAEPSVAKVRTAKSKRAAAAAVAPTTPVPLQPESLKASLTAAAEQAATAQEVPVS